jgi:hypothetical protein
MEGKTKEEGGIELDGVQVPLQMTDGAVNVEYAVEEFRNLEHTIQASQRTLDVEKQGEKGGEGDWDIQEFFEESIRKGEETGHKLKRMGVVVKGLNVVGMGSDADTIPDNFDIIKALWPPNWYVEEKKKREGRARKGRRVKKGREVSNNSIKI